MLSEEKKSWLASVLKVPVERMEPLDMIPRAKGEKYKDEEKKGGWRGGDIKRLQEATHILTHHFDKTEREDNTVSFEEGHALMPDGDYAKGGQNYAIDPKTGEMVLGGGKAAIVRDINKDGTATDKVRETTVGEGINIVQKDPKGKRLEMYHHSSMLQGEDVGGAGVVRFGREGKITSIDNDSGHYTPRFVQLLQTVEHLMKQGALLDQTLVDHEGKPVAKTSAPYKLYEKVQPLVAALPKDRDRIAELLHKLEAPDTTTAQVVKLSQAGDKIVARIETVQKAMAVLGKMGIGPSMKIDDKATVGFLSADGLEGLGFRKDATRTDMKVDEFLMGTGSTGTKANPSRGSLEEGDTEEKTGDEDKVDVTNYMVENYNLKPTTDGYDKLDSLRGDKLDDSGDKGGSPSLDNYDSVESVRAGTPKVSHREGGAKSDMLDELKDVVAKRRPERGKDKGSVITGVAPEVNPEEWLKEVQGLSDALDELEDDDDEEDEDDSFDDLDLSDDEDEDLGVSGGATLGSVTYETKLDKKGNVIKDDTPVGKSPLRDDDGDDLDPFPEEKKGGSSHNYDEPSLRGNSSGKDDKKGKKKPKNKVGDNPYLTSNFEEESPYKDSFVKTQNFEDD